MSFNVQKKDRYCVIKTDQEVLKKSEVVQLIDEVDDVGNTQLSAVIDFSLVKEFKLKAIMELRRLAKYCISQKIPTVILTEKSVEQQLVDHGIHYLIPCYTDMNKAVDSIGKGVIERKSSQAKNIVDTIVKCAQNAIKTMCGTDISKKEVYTRGEKQLPEIDIASIIGFTTVKNKGVMILGFPKETLISLMRRMLEEPKLGFSAEVKSGATEFLNVVIGQLKGELNDLKIVSDIPSLLLGNESLETVPVQLLFNSNSTVITFNTDVGGFFLEFLIYNVSAEDMPS